MKNSKDIGLLIIRLVIGITMIAFHGLGKLMGGPDTWTKIGGSLNNIGINFTPMLFGLSASLIETVGSLLFILGLWTRPVAALLGMTMLIAAISHLSRGDGFSGASHAIELLAVYIGFILIGPGRFSIDKK
ncbi:DoxX family protein [Sphingobacterium sp. HJSM2_6]|uniref:DoxX family protein n=1 Tax=Sphingobacterium sp. HJSM2_6 TaxID=3366264 RepID=UPI003BEDA71F